MATMAIYEKLYNSNENSESSLKDSITFLLKAKTAGNVNSTATSATNSLTTTTPVKKFSKSGSDF